jgi:hypothetical protein
VDATLRDLQGKIMIEFGTGGEAKVEEAAWRSMARDSRDQIVNALAVRAACGTEYPPAEQPVTVRNETATSLRNARCRSGKHRGTSRRASLAAR